MAGTQPDAGSGMTRPDEAAMATLVGLCPMLPGADSLIRGLGLALLTALVLAASGLVAATLCRRIGPEDRRVPACLCVIAATVTLAGVLSRAFFFELHLVLGTTLALLVANCAIFTRTLQLASPTAAGTGAAAVAGDAARFALVLVAVGALRELLGHGSLFDGTQDLLGGGASALVLHPMPASSYFSLAAVPPGAFFALAFLLVAWRIASASGRRP